MNRLLWIIPCLLCACVAVQTAGAEQPTASTPAAADAATVQLGQPFALSPGQSVTLAGDELRIALDAVTDDSRCPQEIECYWAGEATLFGTLSQAGTDLGTFALVIGGGDLVSEQSTAFIGDYQITISALAPAPQAETSIAANEYAATLTVSLSAAASSAPALDDADDTTVRSRQFTGEQDDIAYRYEVIFRPRGDYDGIIYPNDHLLIRYQFDNGGADAILFNRIVSEVEVLGEVYVEPQPDGAIEISQRAFAEPSDRACPARDAPILPRGSWLRTGDIAAGQIYVDLPLNRFTPFDDCTPLPSMPADPAALRVCFGYVRPAADLTIDDNGYINTTFSDLQGLIAAQQLLCSEDFMLESLN